MNIQWMCRLFSAKILSMHTKIRCVKMRALTPTPKYQMLLVYRCVCVSLFFSLSLFRFFHSSKRDAGIVYVCVWTDTMRCALTQIQLALYHAPQNYPKFNKTPLHQVDVPLRMCYMLRHRFELIRSILRLANTWTHGNCE